MKLQKSQKRMLMFLGFVLFYAVFDFVSNAEQYKKYYMSESNAKSSPEIKESLKILPVKKASVRQDLSWRRDPFYQITERKVKTIKKNPGSSLRLNLKAITYDGENSFVMIDDMILMEGEAIQGYKIDKIYKDKVKLSKNGNDQYIYLNSK